MQGNRRNFIHFTTHLFKKHFSIFIVLYFITDINIFSSHHLAALFGVYLIQIISCIESLYLYIYIFI